MKQRKTICWLAGLLAVACVVTFFVRRNETEKEKIRNTDEIILSVPSDEVDSLAWQYDDVSLSLHREENVWQWDEDAAFPMNEEKVTALLSVFENFGAAFVIEDVEDFSQYGLEQPACTITFSADGQEYEVKLGDYSTMDSQRYVSTGDGKVYLVREDPYDTFRVQLSDLIRNDAVPSFEQVSSITFEGSQNYTVTYSEESTDTYCAEDKYFTEIDGVTLPLDTASVQKYYRTVANLKLTDYVSYNVTDEELADWGLDTPELTVSISYSGTGEHGENAEGVFTLQVGRNKKELSEKEAANAKNEEYSGTVTAYVRVADSPIVYRISDTTYNALAAAACNDLRHKEVLTADFDDISGLNITLDGEEYAICSEKKDDERTYSYLEEDVDLTNLHSKLNALNVTEFTDEEPAEKEELSMVLHLDNENYPNISIALYRYDGTSCLAVLDGRTLGLVQRSAVIDLVEAVNTIVLG